MGRILNSPRPSSPGTADSTSKRRNLLVALFGLFVFLFSAWDTWSGVSESRFHPDESRWINRAYYLEELLHPLSDVWEERYLTRGQPPMGSYVIGAGLVLQGRDLTTNGPWDFRFGFESNVAWNVSRNNMPVQDDLVAARRWNLVIGATTCLVVYLIVLQFTNIFGGVVAGMFMAIHPLQHYLSTLATSDAVFTCFVALAVLAAMWLARGPTWWRALLLTLALGAGAATKLSPIFLAVGLAGYGTLLLFDPWLRRLPRIAGRAWRLISRAESGNERRIGIMLLVQPVLVAAFFVLSYPYLWSDPIGRTRAIFDFRRFEMDSQANFWPQAAITTRPEAFRRTWENLNDRYSSSERVLTGLGDMIGRDWSGMSIDLYLAIPGVLVMVYIAWRRGLSSPEALATVAIGGQSALILGALGVDFNRYYLPLLFTFAVSLGVLIGAVSQTALALIQSWRKARSHPNVSSFQHSDEVLPEAAPSQST